MGIVSSKKKDSYILRYNPGDIVLTPKSNEILTRQTTSSSLAKYESKAKIHPMDSFSNLNNNSSLPTPSNKHNPSASVKANASGKGNHLMSKSSSQPAMIGKSPSRSGGPNGAMMMISTKNLGVYGAGIRCSDRYPWLIKSASNFSAYKLSDFEYGRVIGKGLMGVVRLCHTRETTSNSNNSNSIAKYFVLKSIRKDYIKKHNDYRHVHNEKEILTHLSSSASSLSGQSCCCPFVILLFGTYQDSLYVHFALEYLPGGELFSRLAKKRCFAPQVAKFYISEIFCALEHIHSLNYVYRDLKPENILLAEDGHIKLIDFGFARPADANTRMHTICGTPAYLSPEQLDQKFTNGYTNVCDWWSFGIVIYELYIGVTPFCTNSGPFGALNNAICCGSGIAGQMERDHASHYEIFLRILKNKIYFPSGIDSQAKDLVQSLCHPQIEKRLTNVHAIAKHNYFEIPWDIVKEKRLLPFIPKIKEEGDSYYFQKYYDNYLPPNYHESKAASSASASGKKKSGSKKYEVVGGTGVIDLTATAADEDTDAMKQFQGF